jgi:hypothetical protein
LFSRAISQWVGSGSVRAANGELFEPLYDSGRAPVGDGQSSVVAEPAALAATDTGLDELAVAPDAADESLDAAEVTVDVASAAVGRWLITAVSVCPPQADSHSADARHNPVLDTFAIRNNMRAPCARRAIRVRIPVAVQSNARASARDRAAHDVRSACLRCGGGRDKPFRKR